MPRNIYSITRNIYISTNIFVSIHNNVFVLLTTPTHIRKLKFALLWPYNIRQKIELEVFFNYLSIY